MPDVSVALATYNSVRYVEAALHSLLSQDGLREIVVSDDRSTDGTDDILRTFEGPKIKILLNDRNLGQGGNFNRAIRACTGEYIQFFSDDDVAQPGFILSQAAVMGEHDRVGLVYSSCNLIDENGQPLGASDDEGTPLLIDFGTYLKISSRHGALPPSISSVMIRRAVMEESGLLDESLVAAVDLEFFNRVAEKFYLARNRACLLSVRSHCGSVTSNPESPRRYMEEEVRLLRFYQQHLGEDAYRDMMRYRSRHRGADHAKYIMKAVLSGRIAEAKLAYRALAQVHNVPLCMIHALTQKASRGQRGR